MMNKSTEEDFLKWKSDGNVSLNKDGTYSTQDAMWKNKLNGIDALKDYYIREFLD
ncbi:MAG: hypothetical protein ACI8Q1_000227 [Parvicella sp.]|jgi:hypothetical protein